MLKFVLPATRSTQVSRNSSIQLDESNASTSALESNQTNKLDYREARYNSESKNSPNGEFFVLSSIILLKLIICDLFVRNLNFPKTVNFCVFKIFGQ